MKKPSLNLVVLNNCDIYKQLELEEALLRADDENWCIFNFGSNDAIVLGISSKPEEMINIDKLHDKPIQIIKRFSGGGTVYVDKETLFITFICNKKADLSHCYPEPILKWGENFYKPVFNHPHFKLNENDYAFNDKKIGGNALYIRKDRWLLHTSFLWDFDINKINLLKHPPKVPSYRNKRSHGDFLTKLKDYYLDINFLRDSFLHTLHHQFDIHLKLDYLPQNYLQKEYRRSLKDLKIDDL